MRVLMLKTVSTKFGVHILKNKFYNAVESHNGRALVQHPCHSSLYIMVEDNAYTVVNKA